MFVKHKLLSIETILSTHTHTGTCTHKHYDYTKLNLQSLDTWDGWRHQHGTENMAGLKFWEKKCMLHLNESREGFCRRGRGRSFHIDGLNTEKARGTNSRESGAKNLEAESIRSQTESMGGCVKLKTATEIRWSSTCDMFIAESVYLVVNSFTCHSFTLCVLFSHSDTLFCSRSNEWSGWGDASEAAACVYNYSGCEMFSALLYVYSNLEPFWFYWMLWFSSCCWYYTVLWAHTFQSIALYNGYYYYQRNTLLQIIIAKFMFCTHRSLPSLTSTPPTSRLIWMARSMPGRAWPCCLLWTKHVSTRPWRRSTQISPRQRVSVGQGRLSHWWGHSSTTM